MRQAIFRSSRAHYERAAARMPQASVVVRRQKTHLIHRAELARIFAFFHVSAYPLRLKGDRGHPLLRHGAARHNSTRDCRVHGTIDDGLRPGFLPRASRESLLAMYAGYHNISSGRNSCKSITT